MCATYKRHLARLGQQTISTTAVETLCRISIASGRFRVEGKPKRTHEYIISTNATPKDWCKFRQLLLHQYLAPATTTPQPLVRSLRSLAPAGPPPSSTNSTETPTTRQVGAISQPPPQKIRALPARTGSEYNCCSEIPVGVWADHARTTLSFDAAFAQSLGNEVQTNVAWGIRSVGCKYCVPV